MSEDVSSRLKTVRMHLTKAKLNAMAQHGGLPHPNGINSPMAWFREGVNHDGSDNSDESSNSSSSGSTSSSCSSSEEEDERYEREKKRMKKSKTHKSDRKQQKRHKSQSRKVRRKARSTSRHRSSSKNRSRRRSSSRNKDKRRSRSRSERHIRRHHKRAASRGTRSTAIEKRSLAHIHIAEQQRTMATILSELDTQLADKLELKRQEEFERKLDEQLERRNNLLLADLLKGGALGGMSNHAYSGLSNESAHQAHRHSNYPQGQAQSPIALREVAENSYSHSTKEEEKRHQQHQKQQNSGVSSPKSTGDVKSSPTSAKTTSKPNAAKAKSPSSSTKKPIDKEGGKPAEPEENQSIWDKLMDDDCDLLYVSDDEEERLEKERAAAFAKSEKEKKKPPKIIVYGQGRPMYRWRKEGIENPPKDQILRGKLLFRSIVWFLIGVSRMKRDMLRKKEGLLADEIADTEKGVLWFTDKTKSWLAQVLSLLLVDVVTKHDQVLDPKSLGMGLAGKLAFGGGLINKIMKKDSAEGSRSGPTKKDDTSSKLEALALRLKVRLRGILELIIRSLEEDKPPLPVTNATFYLKIATDGCVFPKPFLFPNEESALDFSPLKHTRWMLPPAADGATDSSNADATATTGASMEQNKSITDDNDKRAKTAAKYDLTRVKLILGNFVFNRCLLPLVMRPWESGVAVKPERKQINNLTMLATLIYVMLQEHLGGPLAGESDPSEVKKGGLKLGGIGAIGINVGTGGTNDEGSADKKSKPRNLFSKFKKAKVAAEPEDETNTEEGKTGAEQGPIEPDKIDPEEEGVAGSSIKHPTPYTFAQALFPQKHYAMIQEHLGFLPQLSDLLHTCILKLIIKTFFADDWAEDTEKEFPGLREQLQDEVRALEIKSVGATKRRRLIQERELQLKKRREEAEAAAKEAAAKNKAADEQASQEAESGDNKSEQGDKEKEASNSEDEGESKSKSKSAENSDSDSSSEDSTSDKKEDDVEETENEDIDEAESPSKSGKSENGDSDNDRASKAGSRTSAATRQSKSQKSRRSSNASHFSGTSATSRQRRGSVGSNVSRHSVKSRQSATRSIQSRASSRSRGSAVQEESAPLGSARNQADDNKSITSHRSKSTVRSQRSRASANNKPSSRSRRSSLGSGDQNIATRRTSRVSQDDLPAARKSSRVHQNDGDRESVAVEDDVPSPKSETTKDQIDQPDKESPAPPDTAEKKQIN